MQPEDEYDTALNMLQSGLPEDTYNKILHNSPELLRREGTLPYKRLQRALSASFTYVHSLEGGDYWYRIDNFIYRNT